MNHISTLPQQLELEDGSIGYFYSLQQLEEIAYRKMMRLPMSFMKQHYRDNVINISGHKRAHKNIVIE